jgi:hypothetical protein
VGSEAGQDTTYKAPGGGSPALRRQFRILKDFLHSLDLVSLGPDHATITAAPGARAQALSNGRSQWVIYLEKLSVKEYPLTLNLPKGTFQAEWMDVATGQKLGGTSAANGLLKVPPGDGDKVVVIRSKVPSK